MLNQRSPDVAAIITDTLSEFPLFLFGYLIRVSMTIPLLSDFIEKNFFWVVKQNNLNLLWLPINCALLMI